MNIHRPFLPISAPPPPPPPPPPFCLQCLSTAPGGEKEHPSIQSIQASSRTCGASGVGAPSLSVPLIQGRETVPCHCHAMSGRRTTDGIIANEGRPRGHPLSPSLLLPLSLSLFDTAFLLPAAFGSHFRRAGEDRGKGNSTMRFPAPRKGWPGGCHRWAGCRAEERETYSIVNGHYHSGFSCPGQ